MIRYLAGDEALEVPSPTFTLAQSYDQPFPIVHADKSQHMRRQGLIRVQPQLVLEWIRVNCFLPQVAVRSLFRFRKLFLVESERKRVHGRLDFLPYL